MQVKGLRSKNTIVLHPTEGEPISISKDTNELLFLEVAELLEQGDLSGLLDTYLSIKKKIEKYSTNIFTVDTQKGEMYLKGDDQPMPELITEKLLELEAAGEDFMPLIRFWKRLKNNPSQSSINQLYGFMIHNGIGLTETGHIVVEKGVGVKKGKLVDLHSRTIDNSIGEVVEMPREKVDDDPNRTCSFGLHVGAPQHVRDYYSGIIVKCSVDPADVVAVPTDYNNTKMRVCKYTVLGYSDLNSEHKPVFKLTDFVTLPNEEVQQKIKDSMPEPVTSEDEEVEDVVVDAVEVVVEQDEHADESAEYLDIATDLLSEMTGSKILDYVEKETGVRMTYSVKSKATLVKRGAELLAKHLETLDKK